jgi:hypothetical protein
MQHGLRPDLARSRLTPLLLCMALGSDNDTTVEEAEISRLLLHNCNQDGDLESIDFLLEICCVRLTIGLEAVEWIWVNAATAFDDQELARFRFFLFAGLINRYGDCPGVSHNNEITDKILKLVDNQTLEYYLKSEYRLLGALYYSRESSLDSQLLGASFVKLLTRLGLDVEACMTRESEVLNRGILNDAYFLHGVRKVVFEHVNEGWLLGWTWVLDPSEPGYLLVSEYTGLVADKWYGRDIWPFFPDIPLWDYEAYKSRWRKAEVRFTRRLANKARKERARTGQKRQRSKMPGAWNW